MKSESEYGRSQMAVKAPEGRRNDETPAGTGPGGGFDDRWGRYLILSALQTPAWSEDQRPLANVVVNPLLASVIFELFVIT